MSNLAQYRVRPATLGDVESYVRCQVECLAETYAIIMPPDFAEEHRAAIPDTIADTRSTWADFAQDGEGSTRMWLAYDPNGAAVGVARSGLGVQDWETDLGAPQSAVDFQLHHIYTLSRTHGTGLGQSLLDAAVGAKDAYLWILHGNARAEGLYRRNGFVADGVEMNCGPTWFHRTMFRMVRQAAPPSLCHFR